MGNKFEFKGTIVQLVFYLISLNALTAIIFFLSRTELKIGSVLIVFGIINTSYCATVASKPFKILIDQDKQLLEVHYLLGVFKNPKIVSLREVECSFDYEVRARGGRAKVLRVIYRNKSIVELQPDYNGWREERLLQIFEKLNDLKKR